MIMSILTRGRSYDVPAEEVPGAGADEVEGCGCGTFGALPLCDNDVVGGGAAVDEAVVESDEAVEFAVGTGVAAVAVFVFSFSFSFSFCCSNCCCWCCAIICCCRAFFCL